MKNCQRVSSLFILPSSFLSNRRFLPGAFGARGDFVFAGFVFALPLADLLFDFFGDDVDGGVEIAFTILGEQVRSADAEADRTGELPFRGARVVVLERYARRRD